MCVCVCVCVGGVCVCVWGGGGVGVLLHEVVQAAEAYRILVLRIRID